MSSFAEIEWTRAQRALESARLLAATDPDSAASRAYYAAFHALTAFFAVRGQTFTRHAAIRAALHRDLVQPGILSPESGRTFDYLMDLRETGDYGGLARVSEEDANACLAKAEQFVTALRSLQS